MLTVISPAKRLDWTVDAARAQTDPAFGTEAASLARTARQLGIGDLRRLMGISEDLARLNRDRFAAYQADPSPDLTRPAVLAFAGDTYIGLDARSLDAPALDWAQDHLRILSGLYGLLRPLDRIQPYRLEMGSRLKTRRGTSLYAYWGKLLAKALNGQAEALGTGVLLNCASTEYFTAVDRKTLKPRVITPQFLEERDGEARLVSFFAKKARGALARFVIEHRLTDPDALRGFTSGGYRLDPQASSPERPVFTRPYEAPAGRQEAS